MSDHPLDPDVALHAAGAKFMTLLAKQMNREQSARTAAADVLLTEHGVALAFTERYRHRLRFCFDTGAWYTWVGTHWRQDRKNVALNFARELVAEANRDAAFRTQAVTGRAAFASGVERLARSDPAHAVTADDWDLDPFLLATPGGVVDLRTGQLRAARPTDMMTRLTAVAPAVSGMDCPTWRRLLQDATGGDEEVIRFLQYFCGYCLTGDTREHALLFCYGPGGNGKSVFLNTVSRILGSYAATAAMDTFTASHGDKHSTDLAMLRGARLVCASETEEGRAWAESRVKQMTGGDPVTARFMRQDFFTYQPQFKLMIVGNHKPALRNVDEAARRRFNIVPFLLQPPKPDPELERKLEAEWPAILAWMITGCMSWQASGLLRPATVREATDEYFEVQDTFGRWLAERCIIDPNLETRPGLLLTNFNAWARENGDAEASRVRFRNWAERQGSFRYKKVNGNDFLQGIGLKVPMGGHYEP